jgi:2-(1,2-epoxy-1,2-dihydrophenyl)acetyl-CoA isomerase
MIYKCVADDQFEETITRLAQELSLMPTHALGLTKAALNASMSNTLEQQLQLEEQYQIEAGGTNDYSEGVTAFMEKRKAVFIGR